MSDPTEHEHMSQIDEIVKFLNARYDEREAAARAADKRNASLELRYSWKLSSDEDVVYRAETNELVAGTVDGGVDQADAAHIVLNDPAFVLADIAAKRRIVNAWRSGFPEEDRYTTGWHDFHVHALCLFALPFADHPDYREEEWRP